MQITDTFLRLSNNVASQSSGTAFYSGEKYFFFILKARYAISPKKNSFPAFAGNLG
jgi:hypothetical protein